VRPALRALAAAALALSLAAPTSATSSPGGRPRPPTPVLLERAVDRGQLDRATADRYLAYAFTDHRRIPAPWRSATPWEGTGWLLALRERVEDMPRSPDRAAVRAAMSPADNCDGFSGPVEENTAHFHIHYTTISDPSLDIEDYKASLEAAWTRQVDSFGWAAPPPPASGSYLVAIAPLGSLFGFVTSTGPPPGGDNPNTPWADGDAQRSCMVLNSNYSAFPPSTSQQALDSTTSHEFNHSIQFGYGALGGANVPDAVFYEGGAAWMEDEVFDGANDNYRYLWPDLTDDMGQYRDNNPQQNPYAYWVVWRAITERYGTGTAGGGEQVMQDFWEITSRNQGSNLDAMDLALRNRGSTLAGAYHAAGVALAFNRACGGGYTAPHCLEEGPAYVGARGPTPRHGQIAGLGGSFSDSVLDNYALDWVSLPAGAPLQARLRNTSNGGTLRASLACDTGAGLVVREFPSQASGGETSVVKRFETAGCQSVVAIVSNVAQTGANPASSAARSYQLSVLPPADPSKTSLRVRVRGQDIVATGRLRPRHPGERMVVRLFERDGKRWDRLAIERPPLRKGRRYRAEFARPSASRCRIEARFLGDNDHLPSRRSKTFSC
jgi:hypothetical protein